MACRPFFRRIKVEAHVNVLFAVRSLRRGTAGQGPRKEVVFEDSVNVFLESCMEASHRWSHEDQRRHDDLVIKDLGDPSLVLKPGQLLGRHFVLAEIEDNTAILW